MDKILLTVPLEFIPPPNTIAYRFLELLADGQSHAKAEILAALEDDPRSARQALTSATYGYWLIHNVGDKKGIYQIDERHLSGNLELDKDARAIAAKQLKDRSKRQCEKEMKRYNKALQEQAEAYANYQQRFEFKLIEKPERLPT